MAKNREACDRCGSMGFVYRRDVLGHRWEVPCPDCDAQGHAEYEAELDEIDLGAEVN